MLIRKICEEKIKTDTLISKAEISNIIDIVYEFKHLSHKHHSTFKFIFGVEYYQEIVEDWAKEYCESYGYSYIRLKSRVDTINRIERLFDNNKRLQFHIRASKVRYHRLVVEDIINSMKKEQEDLLNSTDKGIFHYRKKCEFILNYEIINKIDGFNKLNKLGWYHPTNNPFGVTKDHKISIKFGFDNNISPIYLRHPANCEFLTLRENSHKNYRCSLTLPELLNKIKKFSLS